MTQPTTPTPPRDVLDREMLGQMVRDVWIKWAEEQPNPKPSWLALWHELSEPDREVDRRIGETIAAYAIERALAGQGEVERDAERYRHIRNFTGAPSVWNHIIDVDCNGDEMDRVIDKAIARTQEKPR